MKQKRDHIEMAMSRTYLKTELRDQSSGVELISSHNLRSGQIQNFYLLGIKKIHNSKKII